MFHRHLTAPLLAAVLAGHTSAQTVAVDPTFNPGGAGADGTITDMQVLSNGNIMIAGYFGSYNGTSRIQTARLSADGILDPSYVPVSPAAGATGPWQTTAMVAQSDGKVVIANGGNLCSDCQNVPLIKRYNADGSIDAGFYVGSSGGYNSWIWDLALDPATLKIYAAGNILGYTQSSGVFDVVRLQTTGVPDPAYITQNTGAPAPLCLIPQVSGKVMTAGTGPMKRLSNTGSIDATFGTGSMGPSGADINCAVQQPDGKFLVAGSFTTYNGIARKHLARLNADGSLDTSFDPGVGPDNAITAMALRSDGKILIAGEFSTYSGTARARLALLNADGGLDNTFVPGTGPNGTVTSIIPLAGEKILLAGWMTAYDGVPVGRILRLNGNVPQPPFSTSVRTFLEGPYQGSGMMNDALRTLPSFPLTEPFTGMGYAATGYPSGTGINASVLSVPGNNAIVDWMIMELRSSATPGTIMAARPALLQRDGDVVDLDGSSNVSFPGMAGGSYCIALRPRNHLPVMTGPSAPITGNGSGTTVDFTSASTPLWDADARTTILGTLALAAGDVGFNGTVQYTGSGNDRDGILVRVGSTTPNNVAAGYYREDVTMDGNVKYTGALNDRDRILVNVGPTTPNNTRAATLP